jgi:hypothetical protein
LAAEIGSAQVVGRWERQRHKLGVSDSEISVSLRRDSVTRMECAVCDDAGRESRDGGAGTNADASGHLGWAAIGHGGSAEDGEFLGRAKGLRLSLSCQSRNGCNSGEESQD